MIAMAAALRVQRGLDQSRHDGGFEVRPRWELGT
jgi:N6-L-threonylcarbamoyladenine synthase